MFIDEFGGREYPTVILLAPMKVSGMDLYSLMQSHFRSECHIIAPDQGGHGQAGGYHSAQEEFPRLHAERGACDSTGIPALWLHGGGDKGLCGAGRTVYEAGVRADTQRERYPVRILSAPNTLPGWKAVRLPPRAA